MQTQHSKTRCPVYLHPTAVNSPAAVQAVQQATGSLILLAGGRPQLKRSTPPVSDDFGPFGGDAA